MVAFVCRAACKRHGFGHVFKTVKTLKGRFVDKAPGTPDQPQLTGNLNVRGNGNDRNIRPLAGNEKSCPARTGISYHRLDVFQNLGYFARRVSDRIGLAHAAGNRLQILHILEKQRIRLNLSDDLVHHLHRFHRIFSGRRFGRKHYRVGTVINRGRHVGNLRPGGGRFFDHRFEHLGGNDHRPRIFAAGVDNLLLQNRHRLQRTLDPEVAAGNHNTVGKLDNIFQFDDRARFFKLGNNQRPVADQRFCRPHVVGRLNKRKADPVHAHFQGKFQIAPVFFGNCGNRQFDVRQIDALVAGKFSADLNFRHRARRIA